MQYQLKHSYLMLSSYGSIRNFSDCYVLSCNSQPVMLYAPELETGFILAFPYLKSRGHLKITHQDCHWQLLVTQFVKLLPQCT